MKGGGREEMAEAMRMHSPHYQNNQEDVRNRLRFPARGFCPIRISEWQHVDEGSVGRLHRDSHTLNEAQAQIFARLQTVMQALTC